MTTSVLRLPAGVLAPLRRPPAGLPRVRWALLLTALSMAAVEACAGLWVGTGAGRASAAAALAWAALLLVGHARPRLQGVAWDAVSVLLLVVMTAGVGVNQSLGIFYTALFFRVAHASRGRLVAGAVLYLGALALGGFLYDGMTPETLRAVLSQVLGFVFVVFSLSLVLGTMVLHSRELAGERQLLEAVLDSLEVAVVACDRDGRPVQTNAAARAAGLSVPLLLDGADAGRRVRSSDGDAVLPAGSLPLQRGLAGAGVREQPLSVADDAVRGPRQHYLVNARPVLDEDGAPLLVVAALHDVTERRRAEQRLERQALHDALTGLPNRVLLRDRLQQALASAARRGSAPALLFLDLDGFKAVNDSLGHDAGDRVLVTVADRLQACLRPADTLARLGGDEFAVLVEETDLAQAQALADRLVAACSAPVAVDGVVHTVGASVGIAAPGAAELRAGLVEGGDLLRNADLAMYAAKAAGKARAQVYASGMHEALVARVSLERDLRGALERDELRLHYQPVVQLDTGEVEGVEALLRWQSPSRGLVPPDDFIPTAEASGLIVPIGAWVLQTACRQAGEWDRSGRPELAGLRVAVNVSVHQLQAPDLAGTVRAALADSGLPPERLVLEITESAFSDVEATLPRLHELRALGVQLAIDDFGTGYSSLTRLQMFPIDIVKIDRSFVDTISDAQPAPLVTAALALAEAFELRTVAEGVETEAQEAFLRHQGCAVAQGFRYSRAVPADELEAGIEHAVGAVPALSS